MMARGVRNHAGDPVPYQVYKTGPRPLEVILADMRRTGREIARDHLAMITLGVSRTVAAAARRARDRLRTKP